MYILNQRKSMSLINAAKMIMLIEAEGLTDIKVQYTPERRAYTCTLQYNDATELITFLPVGMFEAGTTANDIFDKLINTHFEKSLRDLQLAK